MDEELDELDDIIHQPIRLRIMASLTTLPPESHINFTTLRDILRLTDGNLSVHLRKLEDAGYIEQTKSFANRKPQTFIAATRAGRAAFARHVSALKRLLGEI